MKPIGVSLIGIGGYGAKIAKVLKEIPSSKLVSCYHPNENKARTAAMNLDCAPAMKLEEAIAGNGIDAVVIATPDPSHFYYIQAAIENNKHIFVEKPAVGKIEEALKLDALLKTYGKVFAVGHNMRRMPAFRFLKEEYKAGKLGDPVTFNISLSHGGAFHWTKDYWRTDPKLCREGPMRVNGVHASDILEYLLGPIDEVYAKIYNSYAPQDSPDSGVAIVTVGKAIGTINTHWNVPSLNSFQFQFTEAQTYFDMKTIRIRYGRDVNCVASEDKIIALPDVDVRKEQFEEFFQTIGEGGTIETGWNEGLRAVRFFEACFQSSIRNRPVSLKDMRQ